MTKKLYHTPGQMAMKKFLCYAACYGVLQILDSEVFSTLVLLGVVVYLVSRFFGDVYKETQR